MPDNAHGSLLREVTRLYVRAQRTAADCCGTSPTQCQVITELAKAHIAVLAQEAAHP